MNNFTWMKNLQCGLTHTPPKLWPLFLNQFGRDGITAKKIRMRSSSWCRPKFGRRLLPQSWLVIDMEPLFFWTRGWSMRTTSDNHRWISLNAFLLLTSKGITRRVNSFCFFVLTAPVNKIKNIMANFNWLNSCNLSPKDRFENLQSL